MANEKMPINVYATPENKDLVAELESLIQAVGQYEDVRKNPSVIYDEQYLDLITNNVTEGLDSTFATLYGQDKEFMFFESMTKDDSEELMAVPTAEGHLKNVKQLIENSLHDATSVISGGIPNSNNRNINELTPLDAFIPILIVRSYLPLCGKDLMPYVVPKMDFVRFKELQKWINTKDGNKYRRPDIYNNMQLVSKVLASGKGREVSREWYPLGEELPEGGTAPEGSATYVDEDGVTRVLPEDSIRLNNFDLLLASGGDRNIGDALSHDVYVDEAKGVVVTSDGKKHVVEVAKVNGYYDVTAYTPQRSISFDIKYIVHYDDDDKPDEEFVDRIYGSYDAEKASFEIVSSRGYTKQVKFGGNLSNKNNNEYISFSSSYTTFQHTLPEGIRQNFPITYEDVEIYRRTANVDIVAQAVNEMTDIFIQLEDASVIGKLDECHKVYLNNPNHGGLRFSGQVVCWDLEVDLKYDASCMFKINESNQDRLQYNLSKLIRQIRTVCGNEEFKIHLGCHPNIASLFVGDKYDWTIRPGQSLNDSIRSDYSMGIYTAQGDSMKLIATQKFQEEDGVRVIVYPVNEQNFQTWKHFKRAMYFDKNHHVKEMPNNPNIMGVATFYTHAYIPFQCKMIPKNY